MNKNIVFFIVFFTTVMVKAQISDNVIWHKNIEKAIEKANQEHKRTLVYFSGSDWCKPCIELKKEVFATNEFKTKAQKDFVLVNIDFILDRESLAKKELQYIEKSADKYNKDGAFPLVLILDKDGKTIKTVDGYKSESAKYYIENYLSFKTEKKSVN